MMCVPEHVRWTDLAIEGPCRTLKIKVNIKAAPQHPYLRGVKGNREFTRVVTMLVAIDN